MVLVNKWVFKWCLSMVLAKNWPFFQVVILGNIGQENVFYDILEQTNGFLGIKTSSKS